MIKEHCIEFFEIFCDRCNLIFMTRSHGYFRSQFSTAQEVLDLCIKAGWLYLSTSNTHYCKECRKDFGK